MSTDKTPIYKALDVREHILIGDIEWRNGSTCLGGRVYSTTTDYYVVICENTSNHKRERFEFRKGYETEFAGKTHYYGYTGDYALIIPGDHFIIQKTSTYDEVRILPAG